MPTTLFTDGSQIGYFNNQNYNAEDRFFVDDPNFIQEVYDDCTNNPDLELESRIIQTLQRIEEENIAYSVFGSNSNSAAFQALREIGINNLAPLEGITAPGWEKNPFEGRRTAPYRFLDSPSQWHFGM